MGDLPLPASQNKHEHAVATDTSTVTSLCKDTQCKDTFDVTTMPLATNHCVLAAVASLSKDVLV